MWQVEPPLQYEDDFGESRLHHRPTDEEEVLAVSGSDFVGLMRLARTSLGLTLWQQQIAEDKLFDDNHYFWLHYLSAIVMLNAASDRLREFFVMAVFGARIKAYERQSKECRWYQTPFTQALVVADHSMTELLGKIVPLAEKTFRNREERNKMIHEVATRTGETKRHLTRQRRQHFDEQQACAFVKQTPQFEDIQSRFTEAQALHAAELHKATDQIASWYKDLIQMSSYVFEAENRIRRQAPSQKKQLRNR